MEHFDWDKYFKPLLALSALIASLAVAYYFVVFLPQQAKDEAAARVVQQQEAAAAKDKEEADAQSAETQRQAGLALCLSAAADDYHATWGDTCKGLGEAQDCQLSLEQAKALSDDRNQMNDECYKQYPPK